MKISRYAILAAAPLFAAAALFAVAPANAAVIGADFRTETDLPSLGSGPLIYENLGASVGAGYELDNAHFSENPSGWKGGVVWLNYDPTTNILTLDSQDTRDFFIFDVWISGISFDSIGEHITGITTLSNELIRPLREPTLSFTDDSLHISYDSASSFFFTESTATFQITTIPEPTSLALLSLGGVALLRRRK
jgi:hypothetical protein